MVVYSLACPDELLVFAAARQQPEDRPPILAIATAALSNVAAVERREGGASMRMAL
jgi:hypothetical protein